MTETPQEFLLRIRHFDLESKIIELVHRDLDMASTPDRKLESAIEALREMRTAFIAANEHHKHVHHLGCEPNDEMIAQGYYRGMLALGELWDLPMNNRLKEQVAALELSLEGALARERTAVFDLKQQTDLVASLNKRIGKDKARKRELRAAHKKIQRLQERINRYEEQIDNAAIQAVRWICSNCGATNAHDPKHHYCSIKTNWS